MKKSAPVADKRETRSPLLKTLIDDYENAPSEFKATRYWSDAQKQLNENAASIDTRFMRSGRYDLLRKFGFGELVYRRPTPESSKWAKLKYKVLNSLSAVGRRMPNVMPYGLNLARVRHLSYLHSDFYGKYMGAPDLGALSVSRYGAPEDVFKIGGNTYSIQFLSMYMRYAFAHSALKLTGDEVIVELGQGNGMQIEVLKKLFPRLTVLCFDLPVQTYFSERYLANALGKAEVVSSRGTRNWTDLSQVEPGKVHMFGNWQFPLLKTAGKVDVFWNAASFGEMEPEVVRNYLSLITPVTQYIYLCNAALGKEVVRKGRSGPAVAEPIRYDDYVAILDQFELIRKDTAWGALGPMRQSGGYFQAVWQRKKVNPSGN